MLGLEGETSQAAALSYIESGTKGPFPIVTVVYEENSTDPLQVFNATIVDPWDELAFPNSTTPPKYWSGADTTQQVCQDSSQADVATNNYCFRSDVAVSSHPVSGDIVIESNGCPDHANMMGSNGTIPHLQPDPLGDLYVATDGKQEPSCLCLSL